MKRIQNKVAESRAALPVTAAYAALVCVAALLLEKGEWPAMVCVGVSAMLMMLLNNAHALIRVFSRMVSCSFLAMAVMCPWLLADMRVAGAQLCYALFFTFLFRAYQDKLAVGQVFYAFVAIGVASVCYSQVLFFVPLLWLLLFSNIMAGGWRTFSASVLGLLAPYWVLAAYHVYQHDLVAPTHFFDDIGRFGALFDYSCLTVHQLVAAAVVVLLCLTGVIHFYRTSFKDKIQARMYHEMFAALSLFTIVFIVLQPVSLPWLLPLLMVSASPLVGHFVALTQTRLTNACFVLMVAGVVAVAAYNLIFS